MKQALSLVLSSVLSISVAHAGDVKYGSRDKVAAYGLVIAGAASIAYGQLSVRPGVSAALDKGLSTYGGLAVAGTGLIILAGSSLTDMVKDDSKEAVAFLAAQHRALVAYSKARTLTSSIGMNEDFDVILSKFTCATCSGDEQKAKILASAIVEADILGQRLNSNNQNISEVQINDEIRKFLGIANSDANVALLRMITAQAILNAKMQ